MIVAEGAGQLKRAFAVGNTAAFIYPIGDNSGGAGNNTGLDYSPVSLTISNNSNQRYIGINLVDGQHPNDVTLNNYTSRYWNISDNLNGAGAYSYSATYTYSTIAPSDLVGTHATAAINWWNGSNWNSVITSGAAPNFNIGGLSQSMAPLGLASPVSYTARVNPPQVYVWQPVTGTHDWNDPSKWLPNRFSPQPTDILVFSNGGVTTANNFNNQIISQMIVDNSNIGANPNTDISIVSSTGGLSSLTISGPAFTENLIVDFGATLQLSSAGTSRLLLSQAGGTNSESRISGTLIINPNSSLNNDVGFTGVGYFNRIKPTGVILKQWWKCFWTCTKLNF
jgi:hypothetical protein